MKAWIALILALSLCGCAAQPVPTTEAPVTTIPETTVPETTIPETTVPETTIPETTVPETTVPETTVPETTIPETTAALHSEFYLPDFDTEEILTWFSEVVLQVEYTDGTGDPTRVQKWLQPITCAIEGAPTDEDLAVLEDFLRELNQVPGFPGISMAGEGEYADLTMSFLDAPAFRESFSHVVDGEDAWGACQFWYWTDNNELYEARIGYRTDIPQQDRNSIILEEIVNCLGITDTLRRSDSIVYQDSNENLCLSPIDWLILKLLYHPDVECGMDAAECEAVIRELYY